MNKQEQIKSPEGRIKADHVPLMSLSRQIIRHKKPIVLIFGLVTLVCAFLSLFVSVNYNLVDYLPHGAQSTAALAVLKEEFAQSVPNGRVMLKGVTIEEALDYKARLSKVEGVTSILWLDDVIDMKKPLEMADPATVENYYKNGDALISVTVADGYEKSAVKAIYQIIGDENALSGNAADIATMQSMAARETSRAFLILIPVIIMILVISTSSWIEPFLFLLAIGISILINMGTNLIFGEVSFITQSVSPILQMAVSLDYAIFLLNNFANYRKETDNVSQAMAMAMKRSFPAIAASAATTLFGFLALTFMKFRIGSDLGINLAKGIIFSFISAMVFLPALTLLCTKLIDKTKHKKLLPDFKNIGKGILKLRFVAIALVILVIVPAFLGQRNNSFTYGMESNLSANDRAGRDAMTIKDEFGDSTAIVLLVPRGNSAKEELLCADLAKLDHVTGVIAYVNTVGIAIPEEFVDASITRQFYSENHARIILYADTKAEGDIAFALVEQVQSASKGYYDADVLSCGQSVNLFDMKNVVENDSALVNLIAILAIAGVLLLTFKSISLPVVLLLTIETSIWINLSVPYFTGNPLVFIGYLVISTVQLGATVDYAILLTDHYMDSRRRMPPREAIKAALGETVNSILISGSILSAAGFCLGIISSNQIVSQMGVLIGRGALLSVLMVSLFLPAMLLILDKIIPFTTLKTRFFKEGERHEKI
jgi:uncharacterized protein